MIVWCSFCRKFLSEKAPYDDLSYSHGACGFCSQDIRRQGETKAPPVESLEALEAQLTQMALNDDSSKIDAFIVDCISMGYREIDLIMGVLAPWLAKSRNSSESTLSQFRAFEVILNQLIENWQKRTPQLKQHETVEVLLAVQTSNPHQLGSQLLELWLCSESIKTQSIVGSDETIIEAFVKLRPKVFGISLSDRSQIAGARALIEKVKLIAKLPPLFIVGGFAVKTGVITSDDIPEASLIKDTQKLFLTLKTHLSYGFLYDLKYGSL